MVGNHDLFNPRCCSRSSALPDLFLMRVAASRLWFQPRGFYHLYFDIAIICSWTWRSREAWGGHIMEYGQSSTDEYITWLSLIYVTLCSSLCLRQFKCTAQQCRKFQLRKSEMDWIVEHFICIWWESGRPNLVESSNLDFPTFCEYLKPSLGVSKMVP